MHKNIADKKTRLSHILCKVDRLWNYQYSKEQFMDLKHDLFNELVEFCDLGKPSERDMK